MCQFFRCDHFFVRNPPLGPLNPVLGIHFEVLGTFRRGLEGLLGPSRNLSKGSQNGFEDILDTVRVPSAQLLGMRAVEVEAVREHGPVLEIARAAD